MAHWGHPKLPAPVSGGGLKMGPYSGVSGKQSTSLTHRTPYPSGKTIQVSPQSRSRGSLLHFPAQNPFPLPLVTAPQFSCFSVLHSWGSGFRDRHMKSWRNSLFSIPTHPDPRGWLFNSKTLTGDAGGLCVSLWEVCQNKAPQEGFSTGNWRGDNWWEYHLSPSTQLCLRCTL